MSRQPFAATVIPRSQWPGTRSMTKPPTRVLMVGPYLVQEYDEGHGVTRLSVCGVDAHGAAWMDRIPWDDLQEVKRASGYGDRDAVEVYPPDDDVVNVANMRHLFVFEQPLPFAWKNK